MSERLELTGQKFGRLEVKEFAGIINEKSYWHCVCSCGKVKKVKGSKLRNGTTKSCGCYIKEFHTKHGNAKRSGHTKEYKVWCDMKSRCYNPNIPNYKNYGGRGIKVCDRWLESFENFLEDMGLFPPNMTLERVSNDGGYSKGNCKLATHTEQCNNMRRNRRLNHNGETKTLAQWSRVTGIPQSTLWGRLTRWSVERALTTPVKVRLNAVL